MPRYLKGHIALASLSIVALVAAVDSAPAGADWATTISPSARGVHLAGDATGVSPTTDISARSRTVSKIDPKWGKVTVNRKVAAAYRALPPDLQARLGDPKGGGAVKLAELRSLKVKPLDTYMCAW
jgi:hypothetical protein